MKKFKYKEHLSYGIFSNEILIDDDVSIRTNGLTIMIEYHNIINDEYGTKVLSLNNSNFSILDVHN